MSLQGFTKHLKYGHLGSTFLKNLLHVPLKHPLVTEYPNHLDFSTETLLMLLLLSLSLHTIKSSDRALLLALLNLLRERESGNNSKLSRGNSRPVGSGSKTSDSGGTG